MDLIDRKSVIDVIHKAIFDFFDIVDDDDESPMTYKDEQLLTLNKAIVTKIKALPSAQPEQAVKDCRNCKHGKYNDYHKTYFCYNPENCSNLDKWEASADAVEVVRCMDCKWYYIAKELCLREGMVMSLDDYCGFGERKYERGKAEAVRWIPCKERLPDDGVNVLVQFIDGYTEICRLLGGCWEVLYGEYTGIHTAVAWMPLPEPYKDGEQDERFNQ